MANSLTSNSSQYPLTTFAVNAIKVPPFIPMMRAPTTEDKELAGSRWQDNSVVPPLQYWTTGEGVWFLLGTGTSGLDSLTGDDAVAVLPSLGNINVQGGGTGAIAFTSGGVGQLNAAVQVDNVTIEINAFNQLQTEGSMTGAATTIGAVTADVITFPMGAVPGIRGFQILVAGFDSVTPSGASYEVIGGVRTTGAAAALTGTPDTTDNEDPTFVTADAEIVVAGNNAIVRVTGVAGLTIQWRAKLNSVFAP